MWWSFQLLFSPFQSFPWFLDKYCLHRRWEKRRLLCKGFIQCDYQEEICNFCTLFFTTQLIRSIHFCRRKFGSKGECFWLFIAQNLQLSSYLNVWEALIDVLQSYLSFESLKVWEVLEEVLESYLSPESLKVWEVLEEILESYLSFELLKVL